MKIEKLIPVFAKLREQERLNRALAFAGITHTLCGVEVSPLTPMHRLRLQLLGNAFASAAASPLDGDVFEFLVALHPGGPPSFWQQRKLRRHIRGLYLNQAVREIYEYLVAQLQDMPEAEGGDRQDQSAWVHWIAMDAGFWMNVHGGFTLKDYYETPYLVLQQLYRAWKVNNPSIERGPTGDPVIEEPQFRNGSDRAFAQWHREHQLQIVERIRAQRVRRN